MSEQDDIKYNYALIYYPTLETIEPVLKIILVMSPIVPLPLLNVNGRLVPLLPESTPNVATDSKLVEILTPDTIRKLTSTLNIICRQLTTRSSCITLETRSQA